MKSMAGNTGIRVLITIAVVAVALLAEYAVSDGGVLRWMIAVQDGIESSSNEPAPEPREETPAEAAIVPGDEPEAPPEPAAAPATPPAGVSKAGLGLLATREELPLIYRTWLSVLWPGMARADVVLTRNALSSLPEVHRPPYGYEAAGGTLKPLQDAGIDGYQVYPLVETPPLAVAMLYRANKLQHWMVYEQDTKGLAEDFSRMIKLYAGQLKSAKPAPADAAAVAADSQNFLGDPSIEKDVAPKDMEWSFDSAGGDAKGSWNTDAARTGSYSLGVRASRGADRGWPGWRAQNSYPVEQGQTYLLRAYAWSPDGGNAWLDLQLYDANATWLGGRSTGCRKDIPGAQAWQALELRVKVDDPRVAYAVPGMLQCLNYTQGRGTRVFFDEVFWGPAPQ